MTLRSLTRACLLCAAALLAACEQAKDFHDTAEARDVPCASCHQAAFALAADPKHIDSIPETCGTCHNTKQWTPATVTDHPWYKLDGRHTAASCAGCHSGRPSRYAGTPSECAGCHLADYQKSTYPVHNTLPQTCPDCHNTAGWVPAFGGRHPEANFPILTGSHASPAIGCTDCHDATRGSPVSGQNTDCIHCHLGAHRRPAIDSIHTAFGAAYPGPNASSPNSCLACHKAG